LPAENSAKRPKKRRLDVEVARLAGISRERAQSLIMAGRVAVGGVPVAKAGALVAADAHIDVRDDARFVSRGGAKLERALAAFGWSPSGMHCLDVGASTGGFTDCLLQHGAASVTAIDVGYGQLAWRLRNDARVKAIERCNFRLADPATLGAPFDFATVDVSFISVAKIAGKLCDALRQDARLIVLVKPQFESGRHAVGRGGVVRHAPAHETAIASVAASLAAADLAPQALVYSPLLGPAGNIEFLLGAQKGAPAVALDTAGVVRAAHEALGK
jgi:23S rRNA (cytidine1920-2'-O)/16S rRNA (cytidine1409-2'-O)-methyltransferase